MIGSNVENRAPEAKPALVELLWLAAAVVVAAAVRLNGLAQLAVEHHDEGVYAANLDCGADDGGEFPSRPFYAPPLWPLVIEWTLVAGRLMGLAPDWLPMLPGVLVGIALAPSAWWVARRWFGPAAGMVAAWLVATSEYHAYYSRTALTDAPAVLFWLWAVYWTWRALDMASPRAAILAGVWTALAWWTKYNGWIPLAIAASGGLAAVLLLPAGGRPWRAWLKTLSIEIATAVVLWSPVLWDCRKVGGYAAVAANHRGYLAPWSAWLGDLERQGENFSAYFGVTTAWGLLAAIVGAWLVRPAARPHESPPLSGVTRPRMATRAIVVCWALASFAACVWLAGWTLGCWLGAALAAIGLGLERFARGTLPAKSILAASLLSAWFFGMLLATPVYRPYPRLLMPLWLAASLGLAWLIAEWLDEDLSRDMPNSDLATPAAGLVPGLAIAIAAPADDSARRRWAALACGAVGCALASLAPGRLAEDRTCLMRAADEIAELLPRESASDAMPVVVVYGEPGLFCALTERGIAATARDNLDFSGRSPHTPTYLATGMFVDRDAAFQQAWRGAEGRFQIEKVWELSPSSLVLFDYERPAKWTAETSRRPLRLYRLLGK